MAVIEQYKTKIRVFRWDVKLLRKANPPLEFLYGGLFVIRLTTTFKSRVPKKLYQPQKAEVVPCLKVHLQYLHREILLRDTLQRLPVLRSCKNLDSFVQKLAKDIHCKFRFSPEILSGRALKPVFFLDLEVTMGKEAWEFIRIRDVADRVNNDDYELNKLILGLDLGGEQIEDFLKPHPRVNIEGSKGFDEVKARLEIKVLRDKANAIDHKEEIVCSICFEGFSKGMVVVETACFHIFHRICIFEWLLRSNFCPICRSSCRVCV